MNLRILQSISITGFSLFAQVITKTYNTKAQRNFLPTVIMLFFLCLNYSNAQKTEPIYSQTYVNDTHPATVEVKVYNNLDTDFKATTTQSSVELRNQSNCNFFSEIIAENLTQGGDLDTTGCSSNDSLQICFKINVFDNGGSSQYFHGLVPDFSTCLNVYPTLEGEPGQITVPMTNNTGTGEWQWFPDGVVTYNFPTPDYNPGDPVGAGWFYNFRPGSNPNCTDYSNPNCTWGDGFGYTWEVCFLATPICTEVGTEFCEISFKTFSDGETGGWTQAGCQDDEAWYYSFTKTCCDEPIITNDTFDFAVCSGTLFELELSSNMDPETTYDWSVAPNPYGATSGTGTTISDVLTNYTDAPVTVSYYVTPTCAFGCIGQTRTFIVTIYPEVQVEIPPLGPICEGDVITISAQTSGGGGYAGCVWSNGSTQELIVVSPPVGISTYTVVVTSIYGCTGEASIDIEVFPVPYVEITGPTEICSGDVAALSALAWGGSGDYGYQWSNGSNDASITVSQAGVYSVMVYDLSLGCGPAIADFVVVENAAPPVSILSTGPICEGECVELSAGPGFDAYYWSTGEYNQTILDCPPAGGASYTVTVTDVNGCTGESEIDVIVFPLPEITIDGPTVICSNGSPACFDANPSGGNWGGVANNGGCIDPAILGEGIHSISYHYTDQNGCENEAVYSFEILPSPEPEFYLPELVCQGDVITIEYLNAQVGEVCSWGFGGGTVINNAPLDGPGPFDVLFNVEAVFLLSLTTTLGTCVSDDFYAPISVVGNIEEPEITCVSTLDEITFTWNYVPGAIEYIVNGQSQTGNSFTISNLAPNQSVDIIVEAVSPECGSTFGQASCITSNCAPIGVTIAEVGAICQGESDLITLAATPSGGIWQGSCITDPNIGVFDPSQAPVGINTISYFVQDGQCFYSASIDVLIEAPLEVPMINCISSLDGVQFSWNEIIGSAGYIVNGVFQETTDFEMTDLEPGEEASINIEAVGLGACGSSFGSVSCAALECPNMGIAIAPMGTICQNNGPMTLDATPSGGTWSGSCITDPSNGIFDPAMAPVGENIITYTVEDGPCIYTGDYCD